MNVIPKVYCVNGQPSSGASSLPQWINKRRLAAERTSGKSRKRSKAKVKERGLEESQLTLIQEFGFPEASNKVKSTPDGEFALATGTYKPQVRCYDLNELALKWERHTTSENVDFQVSDIFTLCIKCINVIFRYFHQIGPNLYICKMIEQFQFILNHNCIIQLEYPSLVELLLIIFQLVIL